MRISTMLKILQMLKMLQAIKTQSKPSKYNPSQSQPNKSKVKQKSNMQICTNILPLFVSIKKVEMK